jgi:isocitrate lyase
MTNPTREQQIAAIEKDWAENPRWKGIKRGYSAADVVRLRGSIQVEHTLARRGAEKLWNLVNNDPFVNTLGALTGHQSTPTSWRTGRSWPTGSRRRRWPRCRSATSTT